VKVARTYLQGAPAGGAGRGRSTRASIGTVIHVRVEHFKADGHSALPKRDVAQ
jgi:hypothetical protein